MEQLEERLAMSANPLGGFLGGAIEQQTLVDNLPPMEQHIESTPDFWIDSSKQDALNHQLREIESALEEAHDQTGLDQVRANYGFTGVGQTVAVIDSGIAYDHFALGGGYGSNYRVVGGWDFTGENDADPYDDGPSGGHGTHVAGIIGGDAGNDTGVAPGVDLVALRVFDDAGAGYFSWVENALDWIYTNRDSFENPITTVNLSLGVATWNEETIPSWANLEDEFAQLESVGIFTAVSAGNSFSSFNASGLSYPAASSYVVPVMSTDDSGQLSYFSQRSTRAIAAPGRWITSTVPDYAGNNDGIANDYGTKSGTSMAAPYVAGSSVLIREAMEFVGMTNITQDMIYDHMMATADSFFDSATNQSYSRLNLGAAIDALMPADDFGSTIASAYGLGTVSGPMTMSGAIATLDDIDYFSFTAANTGTVTFAATNTTNDLTPSWVVSGTQSLGALSASGDSVTVDVIAGQEYTVGFASGNGLGYYDFDVTSESTFTFTDWGAVSFSELQGVSATNDTWYRLEATSAGYLSVDTIFDGTAGQVSLEFYDSNLQLVDTGNAINGTSRVDAYVAAGDELFFRVIGTNSNVDFRLTNLVSLSGTTVNVAGTSGDDVFSFTAGSTHVVQVNGVEYNFASIAITDVNFNGGAGSDSITMTGTAGDETATLRVGDATLVGAGFTVNALGIEVVNIYGGGGQDDAVLYDSSGNDSFSTTPQMAELTGLGFESRVHDFFRAYAYATEGGNDNAYFQGSVGNDTLTAGANWAWFSSDNFIYYADGFDQVETYATEGDNDRAYLYGTTGDDTLTAGQNWAWFSGAGYINYAEGFDRVYSFATAGGVDRAYLHDSVGDDVFTTNPTGAWFSGNGYLNYAGGFNRVNAYSTLGGYDRAYLYDSPGDDVLTATPDGAWFTSAGYVSYAGGFEKVLAYATAGGNDRAYLYDSMGSDIYFSNATRSLLRGNGFSNSAHGFEQVRGYSSGGYDSAEFESVLGEDTITGTGVLATTYRLGGSSRTYNFDHITAHLVEEGSNEVDVDAIDYFFETVGV